MFATSEEIDELLGDKVDAALPSVRIGADSPIYAVRLAQAVMRIHPEAAVEVRIDNAREALAKVQDAKVDVAIVSDPPMDGQFFYEPLFADYLMVATPADHPLAAGGAFPLASLARERLLLRETASKTRAATETLLAAANVTPERITELHSREAIREAIALGMGVSLFFSAECPPDPRVAFLRPDRQPDRAQLTGYLVCRIEQRRTAMMRSILAAADALKALSPVPLHGLTAPPPMAIVARRYA